MTTSDENNIPDLRRMIKKGTLPHMNRAYRSKEVIMDENGYLHSRSNISNTEFDKKREELGWRRKNLVFGFNGSEEHTLAQANKIVEMEWEEFKEGHDTSFIDSVKIVMDDII